MTLGGAARVAAARMNGLLTPQSAAITDPPMPQPAALSLSYKTLATGQADSLLNLLNSYQPVHSRRL